MNSQSLPALNSLQYFSLAVVLVFSFSQSVLAEEPLTDSEKLIGQWRILSLRVSGTDIDADKIVEASYLFTKDRMEVIGLQSSVAEMTLRTDKDPNEIDLKSIEGIGKGQKVFGIFRFDGEKLILCLGDERPEKFTGEGNAGLIVLERYKPEE